MPPTTTPICTTPTSRRPTERSYAGIGVVFADYNGRAYVSDVFEGSEAEAKGVQQGDFLTSIDSEDVSAWSMTEVVNALAKDEGATVSVTWMRPASLDAQTGEQFTTTLTCKVYEEANLTTALSDGVGVVKVRPDLEQCRGVGGSGDEIARRAGGRGHRARSAGQRRRIPHPGRRYREPVS